MRHYLWYNLIVPCPVSPNWISNHGTEDEFCCLKKSSISKSLVDQLSGMKGTFIVPCQYLYPVASRLQQIKASLAWHYCLYSTQYHIEKKVYMDDKECSLIFKCRHVSRHSLVHRLGFKDHSSGPGRTHCQKRKPLKSEKKVGEFIMMVFLGSTTPLPHTPLPHYNFSAKVGKKKPWLSPRLFFLIFGT